MTLFKATKLAKTGLNAARLAQFLGYGGALLVLWLLARRAAALIPSNDERWNLFKNILVPLTTLIVVASGQAVMLLVLGPLMNKAWHQIYNWISIAAIILSAAWLLAALFTGSSPLYELPDADDNDIASLLNWIKMECSRAIPALDRIDLYETRGCGAILSWGKEPPALPI